MSTEVVVFREGQEAVRICGLYSPGLRTCSPTDLLSDVARQTVFAEIPALAVIEAHSGALVSIIRERDLVGRSRQRRVQVWACASPAVPTGETGEHSSVVAPRMLVAGVL